MVEALAALGFLFAVAVLPVLATFLACRAIGRAPRYFAICALSVVLAALVQGLVRYFFLWAEYEIFSRFDPEYCVENRWPCQVADLVFGNSWWLFLPVSALLVYALLLFIRTVKP